MPAKTEKVQVLHHLEACAEPMTTQTDEPVKYIIDVNVSFYFLSPIPDNLKGKAEMGVCNCSMFCCTLLMSILVLQ